MSEPDMDLGKRGHDRLMMRLGRLYLAAEQTGDETLAARLRSRAEDIQRELERRARLRDGPDLPEPGDQVWQGGADGGCDLADWR
jgi:hypothetical protein